MSAIFTFLRAVAIAAAAACAAPAMAQTFEAPSCGTGSSDSTCYTVNSAVPTACVDPHPLPSDSQYVNASQSASCGGAGYFGTATQDGHRDVCTGATTWLPVGAMNDKCTNCPNPLTSAENQAMMGSTMELSESVNQAMANYLSSGFSPSMLDGTALTNPLTGQATGTYFREHVWVDPESFSSGLMPAVPRINYLASIGQATANFPSWIPQLPQDPNGNPITSTGALYSMMLSQVSSSGTVACTGNDSNHCDVSCSAPGAGWMQSLCATKTVQYYSCSDSYAVANGATWTPTTGATVPFTASATSGAGDYTMKAWDWGTIFGWNGENSSGGPVFMCDSTINTCNGWVTQSYVYQCRTPATVDCSYQTPDGSGGYTTVPATCATCDVAQGAVWDYLLAQQNDCPAVPVSTRASDSRSVWMTDVAAASCPVLAGPSGPGSVPACPPGQRLDGGGVACVDICTAPAAWDIPSASCLIPPPAGIPPAAACAPASLSKGMSLGSGVALCTLSSGGTITSDAVSSGSLPPGTALSFLGSAAGLTGAPTADGSYLFTITIGYAAGVDGAGNAYPAGTALASAEADIVGCGAQAFSWATGPVTCAATEQPSGTAGVGLTPSLAATAGGGTTVGAVGTDNLSCNASTGVWSASPVSCAVAPTCDTSTIPMDVGTLGGAGNIQFSDAGGPVSGPVASGDVVGQAYRDCSVWPQVTICGQQTFRTEAWTCAAGTWTKTGGCNQLINPSTVSGMSAASADYAAMTCPAALFSIDLDVVSPTNAILSTNPASVSGGNASNAPAGDYLNMLNDTNQTGVNRRLTAFPSNATGAVSYAWTLSGMSGSTHNYSFTLSGGGPLGDWSGAGLSTAGYINGDGSGAVVTGTRSPGDPGGGIFRSATVTVVATDAAGHTATRSTSVSTDLEWEDFPGCMGYSMGHCPPPP